MRPPGSILLVEDDAAVRTVLERRLLREGYDVLVASTAEQAIAAVEFARAPICLALLDVVLPAPGSVAVLEALRPVMSPLRVLIISGFDEASVRRSNLFAALEHEPHLRFLEKPFEMATLIDHIEDLLRRGEAAVEIATGEWRIPA